MRGWGAKQKFLTMLISVISYIHFQDRFLIYIDSFNVMVKLVGGGGVGGDRLLSTVITGHWVEVLDILG